MTDEEFMTAFAECTLPPESFHHKDHVRLAFLYLRRNAAIEALRLFSEGLRKYAGSLGKTTLYHETITWAFVMIIHQRMFDAPAADWDEFERSNPDLLTWQPSILDRYYAPATLNSDMARRVFVFPDRVPSMTDAAALQSGMVSRSPATIR